MPTRSSEQLTALAALGAGTDGLWTPTDARRVLTRGAVQHLVRSGEWQRVWPGVLADGGVALGVAGRTRAAVMAHGPQTVASGRTAARHWGLPLIDDDDPATRARDHLHDDVAVPFQRAARRGPSGRVLHARRLALADGEVVEVDGVRVTTLIRTLWDLARLITHEALVCAMDDALHRKLVTPEQLTALAVDRAGHTGAPAFVKAVGVADGRSESPLETLGRLLLLPVIPTLVPQVRLTRGGQLVARLDLGDRAARFGVEADGMSVHGRPRAVARDRKRTDVLAGGSWSASRFTWWDARRDQVAFVSRTLREWRRAQARASA